MQSLKELLVYRYAFSFYHILHQRLWPDTYPKVTVMKVKGRDDLALGFLNSYVAVAKRGSYDAGDDFAIKLDRIKDHLGGIFFVPTKFRVYYNYLEGNNGAPLTQRPVGVCEGHGRQGRGQVRQSHRPPRGGVRAAAAGGQADLLEGRQSLEPVWRSRGSPHGA